MFQRPTRKANESNHENKSVRLGERGKIKQKRKKSRERKRKREKTS